MGATTRLQLKTNRGEKLCRNLSALLSSFLLAFVFASIFTPVESSNALTCSDGSVSDPGSTSASVGDVCNSASSDVSVTVENPFYISVTSSAGSGSGVVLDYGSSSGNNLGSVITASDTVTTTSNTGKTKHLYISTTSSSNDLTNAAITDPVNNRTFLKAGGGDTLADATSLSNNTWGFNIENNNNFTKVPTLGNDIVIQEEVGEEDEDTGEYVSTQNVYYGVLANTDIYSGSYSNTIRYTAYTEAPETRTIEDITYMQEMTSDICNNTKEGITTALKDIRGSYTDPNTPAEYGVIKAKDGNCWMTDNLNLYGMTVSAAYSDFSSGTYKIPDTSNWANTVTAAAVHRLTASGFSEIVYYNWAASVAIADYTTARTQQNTSICPKGWQLPIRGNIDTDKSWAKYLNGYGFTDNSAGLVTTDESASAYPLGFRKYYGYWADGGAFGYGAARGTTFFWTSTALDSKAASSLQLNSSTISTDNTINKYHGFVIRCVAR